jgi:hypothetical protein
LKPSTNAETLLDSTPDSILWTPPQKWYEIELAEIYGTPEEKAKKSPGSRPGHPRVRRLKGCIFYIINIGTIESFVKDNNPMQQSRVAINLD